jgi:cytochrome c
MRPLACLIRCQIVLAVLLPSGPGEAQLRGHGGPVRALAVSGDGLTLLSGSFDSSAIVWSLPSSTAEQVLRFHASAVNAVAFLGKGHGATAGADGRIAIWTPGRPKPQTVLAGHSGPIAGLAVAPDRALLASASWDGTVRLWPLRGGAPTVLEGHRQNVNGVAFLPNGDAVVSAGYDGTVRIWPLRRSNAPLIVSLPTPLNAVSVAEDGEIVTAGADGRLYFLSAKGELRGSAVASSGALAALSLSGDDALVAAAGIGGVAIIDRRVRKWIRSLAASAGPVWAAVFLPHRHILLTGGADRTIHRWDADTGQALDGGGDKAGGADPLAAYAGDPGAQVFRACVACHTLKPDEGNRAGPSLHGIFGRRIATLPGYRYSDALKHLDIVWTPKTLAKLFELGPAAYTPGTKMPEQRIGSQQDLDALIKFLERATQ